VHREEYTPYGETSYGSFARKRYRFTGKERDEESGLYYHGARYFAPWLARWVSCDPAGMVDGTNLYAYTRGNPLNSVDSSGLQTEGAGGAPPKPVDNITGGGAEGGPQDLQQGKATISGESLVATPWNTFRRWITDAVFDREAYDKATNSGLTRVEPNAVLSMTDQIVESTPDAAANAFLIMAGEIKTGTKSTLAPEKQAASREVEPFGNPPESGPVYHGKMPPGAKSRGEAFNTESLPGDRIFYVGPKGPLETKVIRFNENRVGYDGPAPGNATLDMELITAELKARGVSGNRGAWWSGTHMNPKGEYGGSMLEPAFYANDVRSAMGVRGFKWGVKDVATADPRRFISNGGYAKVPNVYCMCYSSSMFRPPPGLFLPPKLLLLPPKKF
jgi:RHS repeat-associated protein